MKASASKTSRNSGKRPPGSPVARDFNQTLKRRFVIQYAATLFFLLFGIVVLHTQNNWEFQLERNGIKVYTGQQEGSAYRALRATFEAEATLSQYASVVLNVESYKNWNYASANPRVVRRINDRELIYYAEAKAPWPVQDRFVVLHLKVYQDPQSKILKIVLQNVPEIMPEKEGYVRIKDYHSLVTVTALSATRVKVECIVRVDPGGSIPAWVANAAIEQLPVRTFSNLKDRLHSQNAKSGAVPIIHNK